MHNGIRHAMYVSMNAMLKAHNAEIETLMAQALNGELPESDAVRTIILLQRELINALISSNTHSQDASAGLTEESMRFKEAA